LITFISVLFHFFLHSFLFLVCFEPNILNCLVAGFLWCPLPLDALSTCLYCLRDNPALGGGSVLLIFLLFYVVFFASFVFVLWIVHSSLPLRFSQTLNFTLFSWFAFYWSACTKPGKWIVMYLCVTGINVVFTIFLLDLELFRQWDICCFSFYYYLLIVK
jgi:hypothetical protein